MKIGMMADTYKPYVSGVTNYIDLNKRALEKAGHEVYIFTFGDLDHQDGESRIIRSPGLPLADTGFFLSLRYKTAAKKLLQTMDVVHVHHPFLSGRLALSYCQPAQVPIIFTNHTRYDIVAQARMPLIPEEISHSLLQAYMPDFCDEMDLVISPSESMKKIIQGYGVECHIEVVPNGIDLKNFHSAKPLSRADFGFSDDDILLVYAGRIAPEKNLETLLQSFSGVTHVFPNVHLLIVGGGQKDYMDDILELPSELDIENRVQFAGMVDYEKLPAYLAMCDVFVTPSVAETFGMTTVEAMGAGLPAIGIHSPGASDIIKHGVTGYLAQDSLASLTATITIACTNRDLLHKMGIAARKESEQYSIDRTTSIMLEHYTQIAQSPKLKKQKLDERLMSILEEFIK